MTTHQSEALDCLKQMADGSYYAFERFYALYAPLVYRIALRVTNDPMEAEDVCHDVFLEVWDKAEQFDPARGSVEAWLSVRTRSRAVDRLRKKQRYRMESFEGASLAMCSEGSELDEAVVLRWQKERLRVALEQIPAAQRQAVIGVYLENRTHSELAERMNRPLGSVKSLIRCGLRNMRKMIRQANEMHSDGSRTL